MYTLSLIAAIAKNGVIGKDGTLPWYLPDDMTWFLQCTKQHTVIMGANTYHAIGKPLPNRDNRVVSSTLTQKETGCPVYPTLEAALKGCTGEVFVIGGSQLYRAALPQADKLYLTHIDRAYEGDTFFPAVDFSQWRAFYRRALLGDPALEFVIYERAVKKQGDF